MFQLGTEYLKCVKSKKGGVAFVEFRWEGAGYQVGCCLGLAQTLATGVTGDCSLMKFSKTSSCQQHLLNGGSHACVRTVNSRGTTAVDFDGHSVRLAHRRLLGRPTPANGYRDLVFLCLYLYMYCTAKSSCLLAPRKRSLFLGSVVRRLWLTQQLGHIDSTLHVVLVEQEDSLYCCRTGASLGIFIKETQIIQLL